MIPTVGSNTTTSISGVATSSNESSIVGTSIIGASNIGTYSTISSGGISSILGTSSSFTGIKGNSNGMSKLIGISIASGLISSVGSPYLSSSYSKVEKVFV